MSNALSKTLLDIINNSDSVKIRAGGYEYVGPASAPGTGRIVTITDTGGTVWVIDSRDITAIHGVPPEDED